MGAFVAQTIAIVKKAHCSGVPHQQVKYLQSIPICIRFAHGTCSGGWRSSRLEVLNIYE